MPRPSNYHEFMAWIDGLDFSQEEQSELLIASLERVIDASEARSDFDGVAEFPEFVEGHPVNIPARALWYIMKTVDAWDEVESTAEEIKSAG